MPSQRFPHARPQRRVHARYALIGAVAAAVAILAIPAVGPRGNVLDVRGEGAPAAIAQPPTPTAAASPTAGTSPAPSASPDPMTDPSPTRPPAGTPVDLGVDGMRPAIRPFVPNRPRDPTLLTGYAWPLAHPRLTLPFGPTPWGSRVVSGESFHDGVDLATFCGDRVMATHDGVVLAAGRHYDSVMGWVGSLRPYLSRLDRKHLWSQLPIVVVIDDGNGYRSIYAHFGSIVVRRGDRVKAGDLLGKEGMTGRASGCHLHYGLFSPIETATFRIRPDVVRRMKVPKAQIARVDPLVVLPPRAGINAPRRDRTTPAEPTSP